jgi:hypothetical protein
VRFAIGYNSGCPTERSILTTSRNVNLSADLCARAEREWGPKFGGLEALLEYILSYLLQDDPHRMDQAEQNLVEQRLRELGYL